MNRSVEVRDTSDVDQRASFTDKRSSTEGDLFSFGGSSLTGSLKQQKVAEQIKQLEDEIKKRLGSNFNSVRKAFLELDEVHKGSIGAEELAKFIGASKKQNFDFTVLEILVKMRTKGMVSRINYADFVSWLGSSIQPTENFYLRHDSKKNPQYQLNLQKIAEKHTPYQQHVSQVITENDVKERFIARTFTQFKTVKKAFVEWKSGGNNFIEFDHFRRLMDDWGFYAKPEQVNDLLTWIDADGDGKISYEDMRMTVGKEIAPMEQIYFRQDNRGTKQ